MWWSFLDIIEFWKKIVAFVIPLGAVDWRPLTNTNYSTAGGMLISIQDTNYSTEVMVINTQDTNYSTGGMLTTI